MPRASPQLIVFSYHKTGTSLLLHVMTKVAERLNLTMENHFGLVDRLAPEPDVILLPHSLPDFTLDRPFRAIRMIRDPRDIWVSGYLYHQHCTEEWCTNTDMDPSPPIAWPKVDHAFAHRPEHWKRLYLERLRGVSYQQNLRDRSREDGLDFELDGYTGCTLAAMREWKTRSIDALDVKLEDVMADFDAAMLRIFDHFGFTAEQSAAALDVARSEDIRRMDDTTIAARPQIHSRTISKWREVLSAAQINRFEAVYGDLIHELGYEVSVPAPGFGESADAEALLAEASDQLAKHADGITLSWPGSPDEPTPDLGIRLSADGVAIRPTVVSRGSYSFVVPAATEQVRLESHRALSVDRSAPYLGMLRSLGVKVSEIAIRSRSGEVVIPADDPRLIAGWHDVGHTDSELWRWTDGSAEIPWIGVPGPAVVIVRCTAPGERTASDDDPLTSAG